MCSKSAKTSFKKKQSEQKLEFYLHQVAEQESLTALSFFEYRVVNSSVLTNSGWDTNLHKSTLFIIIIIIMSSLLLLLLLFLLLLLLFSLLSASVKFYYSAYKAK